MTRARTQGFSLPELLLVAAILSYSLSVILTTFSGSVALNEASRNMATANSHAEYMLETIRNTTFANIAANIGNGTWNWDTATITANGLIALKSESIAVTSAGTNPLDVTVTVSWSDLNARSRTRALSTTISG